MVGKSQQSRYYLNSNTCISVGILIIEVNRLLMKAAAIKVITEKY